MSNPILPAGETDHNLYGYDPSKSAAYAYAALFALMGLVHFVLMFPLRAAFFIPLILGCAMEGGGYYFRASSSSDTHKILPFVLSGLLILAAPPLLAATIYMTFGRIIKNLKAEASISLNSLKWLTPLFVLGDVICLASQLAGSVLRASDDHTTNQRGSHIVLGGLILQASIFFFFAILTFDFYTRFRRTEKASRFPWDKHVVVLWILSLTFIIRNLVRIVEFLQGGDGYITMHESMLYLFDGTLMLFVVMLLVFVHPGQLLRVVGRDEKITV